MAHRLSCVLRAAAARHRALSFVAAVLSCSVAPALVFAAGAQSERVELRLRSFAPGAQARLVVEPAAWGGRLRLSVINLPRPGAFAPSARTYLVWATGGQVVRVGELRRDARGSGTLLFTHPAAFTRYSLVVTAEPRADADRPAGAPVFSTRAGEVTALYPPKFEARAAAPAPRKETGPATEKARAPAAPPATKAGGAPTALARSGNVAGEFFETIDDVLASSAGARTLVLVGDRGARRARGTAHVTAEEGVAYARVRLRRVPPPRRFGGRRHVLWAVVPSDGLVYMGSLPPNPNRAETYVRAAGVNDKRFRLLVTAERRNPVARPRGRRVVMTFKGRRRGGRRGAPGSGR